MDMYNFTTLYRVNQTLVHGGAQYIPRRRVAPLLHTRSHSIAMVRILGFVLM